MEFVIEKCTMLVMNSGEMRNHRRKRINISEKDQNAWRKKTTTSAWKYWRQTP